MRIGLLAYNSANNFGALLQLLSTYMYLKNHGQEPIIINYSPLDLEKYYSDTTPINQLEINKSFRNTYWVETRKCRNSNDVAKVIEDERISAVIIGSDAVLQHHTFRERIQFPSKTIVSIKKITEDRLYPNPYWGDFLSFSEKCIPIAMMSASSQNSDYKSYGKNIMSQMKHSLSAFCYISVRDLWTQKMVSHITDGEISPIVTPDPVFALNQNYGEQLPTREEIFEKFNIKGRYFVFSFHRRMITQEWISSFVNLCRENGYCCYCLPFANKPSFGTTELSIPFPLSPIDWYCLIKYSDGYFGNNMHPIVIALSNSVPFFSFDNYGRSFFNRYFIDEKSSKIYDIIKDANLLEYRVGCLQRGFVSPSIEHVYNKLLYFDHKTPESFACQQLEKYNKMMTSILNNIENEN